ncbi:Kinesin-like protein [Rhynchospora pubera]|uniref:Kinesin-like protein n=1 Tax=Rhynchospora pubera TaxID=906938 RepID=A0AAV8EZ53_9POAL|nr:Kinesin-like protein [Rhynchospora pubera]
MEETQQGISSISSHPFNGTVTLQSAPCYSPSLSTKKCEKTNSPRIEKSSDWSSVDREAIDSMILVCGPKLIRSGFWEANCFGDDVVMFMNCGGSEIEGAGPSGKFSEDLCFEGGDVIETGEPIAGSGNYTALYQSARYGAFSYKIEGIVPGNYFVDLHFAEIVNTFGPKGMRTFDIFVQEEKIVSGLDIFRIVGANRALQIVDIRASVVQNEALLINFQALRGSPIICGIAIRKASALPSVAKETGDLICSKCSSEMETSVAQNKVRGTLIAKYEKQIQDLISECAAKSEECFNAWCCVESTTDKLRKIEMDLDNKKYKNSTLEQTMERLTGDLSDLTNRYRNDKRRWAQALSDLERKIKIMKEQQCQLSKEAHACVDSIPDLDKMTEAVQALVAQCEDLKSKYSEEMVRSRRLFNEVQESKGNIRVFCRCRPLNKDETSSGCKAIVDFDTARDGEIGVLTGGAAKKTFKFDRVFTPKDDQTDVYADASPLVTSVLDGYNVCIFAYGQTGTGKTFTMEGTEKKRGVNYRTLEELFRIAEERKETVSYSISVSVLEVYNEQIRDLLDPNPSSKKLEIRQAGGEGFHHIPGVVEAKVESIKEVWDVLQAGSNARAVGSNNVNEHSSRSHCMLCIMIEAKNLMNGECTKSKLWLVDLAGSERLAKTDAQGERLKEAQNINRSLSALGDVISALANKSSHIPYRNSKLTHLLQDSLGGDAKALMFVQISPSDNDLGETLSSLNFASRVRGIELGPAKKQVDTSELQKMKQMLEKTKREARIKDENIRKLEESCLNLENKLKGNHKSLQEKMESHKTELQISLEKQNRHFSEKLKEKDEMCSALHQKVKVLETKLRQHEGHDTENILLQQKIKELELQVKESEKNRSAAEQKLKELDIRLLESRRSESKLETKLLERQQAELKLQTKVRDLEMMLKELNEKPTQLNYLATPKEVVTDHRILASSNYINKPLAPIVSAKESLLLSGVESLQEIKRKRVSRDSVPGENENSVPVVESRKKSLLTEPSNSSKTRRLDPTKGLARFTRTSNVGTSGIQKVLPHGKAGRESTGSKIRGWVR